MNKRNQTIWTLLVVLSILFMVLNGFRLYPIQKKYRQIESRSRETHFGTDEELERTIEYLEKRLEKRSSYTFSLEKEPMRLQNVLYVYDAQGRRLRYRDSRKLRVTAVFIGGSRPQALIRYKDLNYTVSIGDSLAGGEIIWIDADEVVFSKENKEIHYPVTAPEQNQ
ncbi:MAG: hypothetical protein ACE5D8_07065 [Fidelibacterota bacterium]